jgi:hypothetical protein
MPRPHTPRQLTLCLAHSPVQRVIKIESDKFKCGLNYAVYVWAVNAAGQSNEPIEFGGGGPNQFTPTC